MAGRIGHGRSMGRTLCATGLLLLASGAALSAGEVKITLRGSRASMERQNRVAHELDLSFLRTNRDVARFADAGRLVPVPGGDDYRVLAEWPYARAVVRDFVELLAGEYRSGCGEQLVVTSLTRPLGRQPGNASPLSVHPAGMAVDLRVSERARCVRWLEGELLRLESEGLLDGTREYHPPHFHVAVFPEAFQAYLDARAADSVRVAQARSDSLADAVSRELLAAQAPLPEVSTALAQPAPAWTPATLLGDLFAILGRLLLRV